MGSRRDREAEGERRPKWECPNCDSRNVVRRPPSQISPHPGYVCRDCGTVMRARGMAVVYLAVLLIAIGFLSLFGYLASIGEFKVGNAWKPILAVVCAGYSIRQLFRPVPKRVELDDEAAGRG
jgi:ribosomal protein L37AE/L43A